MAKKKRAQWHAFLICGIVIYLSQLRSFERSNVACELAFKVGTFILVPCIASYELVDHTDHTWEEFRRLLVIFHLTQLTDSRTC